MSCRSTDNANIFQARPGDIRSIVVACGLVSVTMFWAALHAPQAAAQSPPAREQQIGLLRRESEAGRDCYVAGEYEQAVRHMSAAANIAREVRGRRHPDYLHCLNNLAMAYSAQGNEVRAQRILHDVARLTRQRFGDDSLEYALAANNLGGSVPVVGRPPTGRIVAHQRLGYSPAGTGGR